MDPLYKRLVDGRPSGDAVLISRVDAGGRALGKNPSDIVLLKIGYCRYIPTEKPDVEAGQIAIQADDIQTGPLEWSRAWTVRDKTAEELEADRVAALSAFTPAQIVAALQTMGVANLILANTDELTKARFYTAARVREDNEELLTALSAVKKTIDDLKKAVV